MTVGKRARAGIYHETQTGNLCALHAINNLLQDAVFTANDLIHIGQELDKNERALIQSSSGDVDDSLELPQNLDLSGNFSIQVIIVALAFCGLELVSLNSSDPRAILADQNTYSQQAFLCHKNDHWFTIRKFGSKWFNLNSLLPRPKKVSHNGSHLSLFATKELRDRYTGIFVVFGNLPNAETKESDESGDSGRSPEDPIGISPISLNQEPQQCILRDDKGPSTDRYPINQERKWRQTIANLLKLLHGEWKS
ncbi:ataxin-3-like [Daphnia carinata]|uniref:ataxin-3-like n=1 Tax=Daphnia carinata TaxID=120202 RepID=UPI0028686614|nr:ataxin-3-like [Daphnia carinata]